MIDYQLVMLRERLYNNVLTLRSIERLISSNSFELAWSVANAQQRSEVLDHIEKLCCSGIKRWIRSLNQASLNIRELKERASQLGIPCYSRMDKQTLLTAIYSKEEVNASKRDSRDSPPPSENTGNPLSLEAGRNNLQEGQADSTERKTAI